MDSGYSNCYPKSPAFVNAPRTNTNSTHIATAQPRDLNNTCQDSSTYVASNKKQFIISCNQDRVATYIAIYHDTSLENCAQTCATWSSGNCTAAVFDPKMTGGYENCYLKSGDGVPNRNSDFRVAILLDELAEEENGIIENGTDQGDGTNAASHGVSAGVIAGPVVGAVALIAMLIALLVWWRKRQPKKTNLPMQDAGYAMDEKAAPNGYSHMPSMRTEENAPVEASAADTALVEVPAMSSRNQANARNPTGSNGVHEM